MKRTAKTINGIASGQRGGLRGAGRKLAKNRPRRRRAHQILADEVSCITVLVPQSGDCRCRTHTVGRLSMAKPRES